MDSNEHASRIKPLNHGDLTALLNQAPRQASGTTVRSRRSRERAPLRSTDGRRRRSTGRDKQFNVKVRPDIFEIVADMCERYDLTKSEFTERAFLRFVDTLREGKGDGVSSD
jgi:hypothetical protein